MHKHQIRQNKTCQNCGAFVEKIYCPKCGQENSESRQAFHHLFSHFIFDLIHYDGSFWKTAKYLFLSPAKLPVEYMNGKRKSYVNPFTLYIFVSFLAFFIPSILPDPDNADKSFMNGSKDGITMEVKDSLGNSLNKEDVRYIVVQLDSIYKSISDDDKPMAAEGVIYENAIKILHNIQDKHRKEKALELFLHNIPKALFIYMPLFAFWLWVFHDKKKRHYFDSGIFTLHFFSVLLLTITVCNVIGCIFNWLNWTETPYLLLWLSMALYITFYFFRANRIFYGESRLVSNIKAFILVGINSFLILLILLMYTICIFYIAYH